MRLLLLLFISFITLYANANRHAIVKEYQLSQDGIHYSKIQDFHSLEDIKDYVGATLFHKIILDKEVIGAHTYYLKSLGNADGVQKVSLTYSVVDNNIIIKIDKNTPSEIIIETKAPNRASFLLFNVLDDYELLKIFPMEKFWFGLVYGLMFYAFLNSLIFFIYNRQKSFLYYAFLQLSLILFLMNFSYWSEFYGVLAEYVNIYGLSIDLSIIFSILFNMAFLETKKYLPRFHKILLAALWISMIDLFTILLWKSSVVFEYLPPYYLLILLIISAVLVVRKGDIEARYYLVGWSVLVLGVIVSAMRLIDLNGIYTLHILFPFETIVFSFALGYQLVQVQKRALAQEKILMQQSKLASMGEMVANIAHQWRQPLNNISCTMMNLKAAQKHQKLTDVLFEKKSRQIDEQLKFMSETIEDFREFFMLEKQKHAFYVKEVCERSYLLATSHLNDMEITFVLEADEWMMINTYENELSHVVFNLINNAIEAFKTENISTPKLQITVIEEEKWICIQVSDNAKGIPKKLLEKIFEPYFSTKEKGMGIGLYMSKMIIEEHMQGRLDVENWKDGTRFEIRIPLR